MKNLNYSIILLLCSIASSGCSNKSDPGPNCAGIPDIEVMSFRHRHADTDPNDGAQFFVFDIVIRSTDDTYGCTDPVSCDYSLKAYRSDKPDEVYTEKIVYKNGLKMARDEYHTSLMFHDSGYYTIIFEADAGNQVTERDESNNSYTTEFIIRI
jgi:hypothetical protein